MATITSVNAIDPYTKEKMGDIVLPTTTNNVLLSDKTTLENWLMNLIDAQAEVNKLITKIQGALNASLSDIATGTYIDYTNGIEKTSFVSSLFSTQVYRYACFTFFEYNITFAAGTNNRVNLGTLPEGARPKESVCKNVISNKNVPVYIYADPNGSFGVAKITAGALGTDGVRDIMFYVN